MKKIILYTLFIFGFVLFFNTKINALNEKFCNFNEVSLKLPASVGYDITYYDMQLMQKNERLTFPIHDKDSCLNVNKDLNIDLIDVWVVDFYYFYHDSNDNVIKKIDKLSNATFSNVDTFPPVFTNYIKEKNAYASTLLDINELSSLFQAIDSNDGICEVKLISNTYTDNYNIPGKYLLTYQACDTNNNCSKLTLTITVKDNIIPTISGPNHYKSYLSSPVHINTITANLIALDNDEINLNSSIQLDYTNYNPNNNITGTYYAHYIVKDKSGNKSLPFKVSIEVIDDIAPIIEGPTLFKNYLSRPINSDLIKNSLICSDSSDLNAHKNLYIKSDNFTNSNKQVGNYNIIFSCYDKSENESLPHVVEIITIDDIKPSIEGVSTYTTYLSNPISLSSIKNNLIAKDNVDGNLYNNIEILNDNYSININKIGIFTINFRVKDNSNNYSEAFIVTISVIDDIAPFIEGKNFYETTTKEKLNILNIQANLKAIDNVDGDITNNIILDQDTYSDSFSKMGTYYLPFYVIDKSGNISNYYNVKIIVKEEVSELSTLNNSYILINNGDNYTSDNFLSLLNINIKDYSKIEILENTYKDNYNKDGLYYITYQISDSNFDLYEFKININVKSKNEINNVDNKISDNIANSTTNNEKKKESIFSKIGSFFKKIFIAISDFFKRLFKK